MQTTIQILQLVTASLIVVLILLQERSAGLSGIFGGEGGFYQTRRGLEKIIFIATIVCTAVFVVLAVWQHKI